MLTKPKLATITLALCAVCSSALAGITCPSPYAISGQTFSEVVKVHPNNQFAITSYNLISYQGHRWFVGLAPVSAPNAVQAINRGNELIRFVSAPITSEAQDFNIVEFKKSYHTCEYIIQGKPNTGVIALNSKDIDKGHFPTEINKIIEHVR